MVVSSLTLLAFLFVAQNSLLGIDIIVLLVLGVLWLTMGAYTADIIGHQLCYSLRGQAIPAKNGSTYSAESYCRQMKVSGLVIRFIDLINLPQAILAFSWANFVALLIAFGVLLMITSMMSEKGYNDVWSTPISGITWNDDSEGTHRRQGRYSGQMQEYTYPEQTQEYLRQPDDYPRSPEFSRPRSTHSGRSGRSGRSSRAYAYYPDVSSGSSAPRQRPGHSVIVQNGQVTQVPGSGPPFIEFEVVCRANRSLKAREANERTCHLYTPPGGLTNYQDINAQFIQQGQAQPVCVVLGICANLTTHFLPTGLRSPLKVASTLTIVAFILLALRSQPRIDAVVLFVLTVLWLTMGAYSQDVIGHQFCYALKGQNIPAKNNTTFSAENYCRQMKTVLAFSWANFVFLSLSLIGLLTLVIKIYARGDQDIWANSMSDVTIFTEKPDIKPLGPQEYPMGSTSGRSGQTYVYYPGHNGAPLQHQACHSTGVSCAIAVQLALLALPGLRPYGTLIQILLALGACGTLAYVVSNDRRQNGNLTRDENGRNELKMIGMFFILWLTFALMFRTTSTGGAHSPSKAVAPTSDTHRNHDRERYDPYSNGYGRRCRGSYCVYEEWYY
ncbi:hypothetical protein CTheo_1052 [Ceratobasidium theobromae]|uniref:Transmembrane protein n=1 Tax=Ceratobasidium theobromae TaxID=1582974 RepID=A0A5N5QVI7_9AGAM|nr:hypothetical protein CTheo_1052 [Ceratobasidium theobromae]